VTAGAIFLAWQRYDSKEKGPYLGQTFDPKEAERKNKAILAVNSDKKN